MGNFIICAVKLVDEIHTNKNKHDQKNDLQIGE